MLSSLSLLQGTVIDRRNSSSFRDAVLKSHNGYRSKHHAQAMAWDANAASFAQNWCDYLSRNNKLVHSDNSPYGENLYKSYSSSLNDDDVYFGEAATKSWYDEVKDYDYSSPGFSLDTGHFTQVVWGASTGLGCGISRGEESGWKTTYVCCSYSPPGNYQNQFPDNVKSP